MREEILTYQHNFFKNARNEAAKESGKAIVFGDEKDAAKTYHLAEILKRHQIKFNEIKQDFTVNGKHFKKGYSYIIPKNQKNTRLINAMFEIRTTFKDSLFYDVSAWTFPLAFNLDYAEGVSTKKIEISIITAIIKIFSIVPIPGFSSRNTQNDNAPRLTKNVTTPIEKSIFNEIP